MTPPDEREVDPQISVLDGRSGPALPIHPDAAARMVSAALGAALPAPKGSAAPSARAHEPAPKAHVAASPRRRVRWSVVAVAAALVLLAGVVAAYVARARSGGTTRTTTPPLEELPLPAAQPEARATASDPAPETTTRDAPEPTAPPAPSAPPAAKPLAEDLLRTANDRRREHRWRDAEQTYQKVIRGAPGSAAAYSATVAAASLRLEQLGDPAGALRLFRAALAQRSGGALAEEARWGVAEAHRALGDRAAEADALRAFVSAHPSSLMVSNAQKRLKALSGAGSSSTGENDGGR